MIQIPCCPAFLSCRLFSSAPGQVTLVTKMKKIACAGRVDAGAAKRGAVARRWRREERSPPRARLAAGKRSWLRADHGHALLRIRRATGVSGAARALSRGEGDGGALLPLKPVALALDERLLDEGESYHVRMTSLPLQGLRLHTMAA